MNVYRRTWIYILYVYHVIDYYDMNAYKYFLAWTLRYTNHLLNSGELIKVNFN